MPRLSTPLLLLAGLLWAGLLETALLETGLLWAQEASARSPANSSESRIDFVSQVQPILAKRCYSCHGPDESESGLSFVDRDTALAETESGGFAIVPGNTSESLLLARVTSDDEPMPPEGDRLSSAEIEILRRWIDEGAAWDRHWAFKPMQRPPVPEVSEAEGNNHPIDAFLYRSLTDRGLKPNPPADRRTLIRRAYYDLTGLPPTVDEVEQFVSDPDANAYEKLIDRLLRSPHYGEHWGRHWLDLVRFAETNSYERDGAKPNAWKYRDYVIRSFNNDKPYDRFLSEQLAGDELDEVTTETLTATGYYRLGIWDDEPADPLQARFDELDDIIMTTGQAMLGLTVNCARCHDHKIDPIPQRDYYSMLAFLADVTPYGIRSDQRSNNQIDVSTEELKARYTDLEAQRGRLAREMLQIEQLGIAKMSAPDQRATEGPKAIRRRILRTKLKDHLEPDQWSDYRELKQQHDDVAKAIKQLPERDEVLGLGRVTSAPEQTFILYRGNPHAPRDEVRPAFPSLFDQTAPSSFRSTERSAGRRRVLAEWITSPDNRLTARVMANRVWQFHFGRGIVRSSNNFGQLGIPPTHPELLDWLANQLIDNQWKLKSLHRLIMTSRVYQMSSDNQSSAAAVDPGNDGLWRFEPRRLSAEEVRDSILQVNGSLNRELYGPSIYPKLSQEVLAGQSRPGNGWGDSPLEDRNRRSIYIHVKRSLLTPLLSAFDFPDPDLTCEERFVTLQPGQALALLNSNFIDEQSRRLAESIGAFELADHQIVRATVRAVVLREATDRELREGASLIQSLQESGVARDRAVQLYCLTVLNWNEFLFLE